MSGKRYDEPPRNRRVLEQRLRALAEQLGFAPADVHQAATDVQAIIARIDAARPTD